MKIAQYVQYNFDAANFTDGYVRDFSMLRSHSILTSAKNISADSTDGSVFIDVKNLNVLLDRVTAIFPKSGIAPMQATHFSFKFDWHGGTYRNAEHIIIDPWQYAMNAVPIALALCSNNEAINCSRVTILEINRSTFEKTEIATYRFSDAQTDIIPQKGCLYLIRIEREQG